jgi:hypothetical protein
MKTKMTLLILATAIATLSFSFVATNVETAPKAEVQKATSTEPVGGLVSEQY